MSSMSSLKRGYFIRLVIVLISLASYVQPSWAFKELPDALTNKALSPKLMIETGERFRSQDSYYDAQIGLSLDRIEMSNALFSLAYETFDLSWYQLNHPDLQGLSRPIERIERWRGHLRLPYRLDSHRLWLAEAALADTREQGAQSSLTFEGFLLYSQARNLHQTDFDSWQLGVFVQQSPVETVVLPIVEITFNLSNPNLEGFYGHLGFPKTQLGYHLGPHLRTDVEFVYCQITAGLRKDNGLLANGYSQLKSWRSEWRTTYRIATNLEVYLAVKQTLTREWVRYDKFKTRTGMSDLENTFGYGVGIQWQLW